MACPCGEAEQTTRCTSLAGFLIDVCVAAAAMACLGTFSFKVSLKVRVLKACGSSPKICRLTRRLARLELLK